MANLFTDPLSQITLQDVEQFLNVQAPPTSRPKEGPRLDFKQDAPQDLGWDVAGLANSYGGILLIGVEKDKANKNVPASMSGTDLGNDPSARLTEMILATVHPRPNFEVHPIAMSVPRKGVAIIRVAPGTFPPYEYSQGGDVGIPIRIVDTTRQATLQEIEALLRTRELAARAPHEVVGQYLNASDFFCSVEGGNQGKQLIRDPYFLKLILTPRVPGRLRLDLAFERASRELIQDVYRNERNFLSAHRGLLYDPRYSRHSLFHEFHFRISGKAPCHRVWRIWSDGTLGFVANHSRIKTPEAAGNFALEALLFLRLGHQLFEGRGFFGPSVIAYRVACPSHQFTAEFPYPDPDFVDAYDGADGLYFDGPSQGQPAEASYVEDLNWDTLTQPEELVASILLDLFRAVAGARIDYTKLLGHVTRLSKNLP